MKKLFSNKISKRDDELRQAFLSGITMGGAVDHKYKTESEAYFLIEWAKERHVTLPEKFEKYDGVWSL